MLGIFLMLTILFTMTLAHADSGSQASVESQLKGLEDDLAKRRCSCSDLRDRTDQIWVTLLENPSLLSLVRRQVVEWSQKLQVVCDAPMRDFI